MPINDRALVNDRSLRGACRTCCRNEQHQNEAGTDRMISPRSHRLGPWPLLAPLVLVLLHPDRSGPGIITSAKCGSLCAPWFSGFTSYQALLHYGHRPLLFFAPAVGPVAPAITFSATNVVRCKSQHQKNGRCSLNKLPTGVMHHGGSTHVHERLGRNTGAQFNPHQVSTGSK